MGISCSKLLLGKVCFDTVMCKILSRRCVNTSVIDLKLKVSFRVLVAVVCCICMMWRFFVLLKRFVCEKREILSFMGKEGKFAHFSGSFALDQDLI